MHAVYDTTITTKVLCWCYDTLIAEFACETFSALAAITSFHVDAASTIFTRIVLTFIHIWRKKRN